MSQSVSQIRPPGKPIAIRHKPNSTEVASAVSGIPEVVLDGRTGFLFKPRDVPGIAEAILALAADPERARAMGRAGRELALREFATDVRVERTEALYRSLLAARGRP